MAQVLVAQMLVAQALLSTFKVLGEAVAPLFQEILYCFT
jgi:hypothetical protein